MTTTSTDTKFTARQVLTTMNPGEVGDLVARLDEANRYLLAVEMTKLLQSMGSLVTCKEAEAYGRMFQSLGPARLKLHVWNKLMSDENVGFEQRAHAASIVHQWVAPEIVTRVFGVPMGEAGRGHAPQLGVTDNDRFDCFVLLQYPKAFDLNEFYSKIVDAARLHGTIVIEETV